MVADTVKNYTYDNSGNMLSDGEMSYLYDDFGRLEPKKSGYHYYHLDEQNSTAYITGGSGEIENRYEYDAFGVLQNSREELPNRILYTGQQYDQDQRAVIICGQGFTIRCWEGLCRRMCTAETG